ncbi:hypothetical protein DL765_004100 [Monosporascus sp. GIB2]|nr:hypothetical protein DL765_004100 [Monosporascus sp. GIB2]
MRCLATYAVFSALSLTVHSAPRHTSAWAHQLTGDMAPASIPQNGSDPEGCAAGVGERRASFGYGLTTPCWMWIEIRFDAAVARDVEATTAAIQDYPLRGYVEELKPPLGETQGIMTNFTHDLLFSMETLSQNPYPLELVKPSDPLPFDVPEDLAPRIAGVSLDELRKNGSLFVVDHRYQNELEKTTVQPQRYERPPPHTFMCTETLSLSTFGPSANNHNSVGEELCFNPGGHWDQLFYVNNIGCRDYVTNNWPTREAYQGGYLKNDFQVRGLVGKNNVFKFKFFPFDQDALKSQEIYRGYFVAFVDSYYSSDGDVAADSERQNCIIHHGLNGGNLVGSKATLPFHLNAMYAPLPTEKGVTDLLPFLPSAPNPLGAGRALYRIHSYLQQAILPDFGAHTRTRAPAADFGARMNGLRFEIRARGFDEKGLSLGMPFIYRTLDPGYIPYFSAV